MMLLRRIQRPFTTKFGSNPRKNVFQILGLVKCLLFSGINAIFHENIYLRAFLVEHLPAFCDQVEHFML